MQGAGVVKGGEALEVKVQSASDDADPPDQLVGPLGGADRHVVFDLTHAIFVQEPGD